jgi:hypothetical protein
MSEQMTPFAATTYFLHMLGVAEDDPPPDRSHPAAVILRIESEKGAPSDPRRVWNAFKQFSAERVECESDVLLFQAGDSEIRNDIYFDFCREFRLRGADNVVWYEQIHAEFLAHRPRRLHFNGTTSWSYDFDSLPEFFVAVEALPEFNAGVSFRHWSFSVYHTYV